MIKEYEKKIYEQEQLISISKALNSNLELSFLIETILNVVVTHGKTIAVAVFIAENYSETDFLLFSKYIGLDNDRFKDIKLTLNKPLLQLLTKEKHPTYLSALKVKANDNSLSKDEIDKIQSFYVDPLLVPFLFHRTMVGLLLLGERQDCKPYTQSQIDFFLNLSHIAAIAINNAKLYYIATTDYLTLLKTHQFFQTKIDELIISSQENHSPLSILLLDIDFFKKINDNYGHLSGDHILKKVAQIFQENSETTDICCRYGGEEFVAILPNTNLSKAKKIAQSLRKKIEQQKFQVKGEKDVSLTISIGVTQYQENDLHKEIFIGRCDQALYLAKNKGRNRVEAL